MKRLSQKKGFFRTNLKLKILAIFFALGLEYYFYSPDNSVVVTLPVNVEFASLPVDYVVVDPNLTYEGILDVRIKGPRPIMQSLKDTDHKVSLSSPQDLSKNHKVYFRRSMFHFPSAVEVLSVVPSEMEFTFDKIIEQTVPIKLRSSGALPKKFNLTKISYQPQYVLIKAASRELQKISSVDTEIFDLSKVDREGAYTVSLHRELEQGSYQPKEISVFLKLVSNQSKDSKVVNKTKK